MVLGNLVNDANGKKFSELLFDLRVNSSTLDSVLKALQELEFVSKTNDIYSATERGRNSLRALADLVGDSWHAKSSLSNSMVMTTKGKRSAKGRV